MPIIKSAKKRVRTAEKAAIANSKTRKSVRNAIKALQQAIESGDKKAMPDLYANAQSTIDTAVKKNIFHKNKAARKKSKLSSEVKAAGGTIKPKAKPSTAKPAAKKAATNKKPVAKKPAVKKPSAKKPAKK